MAHHQTRKRGPRPGARGVARPEGARPSALRPSAPREQGEPRAVGAVGRLERGPRQEVRTCVGCGQQGEASAMVRLVLAPASEGEPPAGEPAQTVVVDAKGGRFGRGAHVHPLRACLERAQKGLSRSFRGRIVVEPAGLAEAIQVAYARRLSGLLGGGVRAGLVAIGTDAVVESLRAGSANLVLVAADASAAAQRGEIAGAIGAGRALVLWDRARLAAALGRISSMARDGVAVASVLDPRLARAVREAWVAMNVGSNVKAEATADVTVPPGGEAAVDVPDGASKVSSEVGSSVEGSESAE